MREFTVLKVYSEEFQVRCPHCDAVQRQINVMDGGFEGLVEVGCDSCCDAFTLHIGPADEQD